MENELLVKENRNKHLSVPGRDENFLWVKLMGIATEENISTYKNMKISQS